MNDRARGFARHASLLGLLVAAVVAPAASATSCGGGGNGVAASSGATVSSSSTGGAGGSTSSLTLASSGGGTGTCGGPPPSDAGPAGDAGDASTGCEGLDAGVSWSAVMPLFAGCIGEACHADPGWLPSFMRDVPAYECCDHRAIVAPGNPSASYVIDKLTGQNMCVPHRMPLNGPPYLADADVELIRAWICGGAPGP